MAINEEDLPYGPIFFTFTVRAKMNGFEGDLEIKASSMNELKKTVRLLPEAGVTPVVSPKAWDRTPEGLPICPKHGVPMRKRERQGDEWHSHNAGSEREELWCRGYPGKDSPGWDVEPAETSVERKPEPAPPTRRTWGRS